jgi:hypothetical protein
MAGMRAAEDDAQLAPPVVIFAGRLVRLNGLVALPLSLALLALVCVGFAIPIMGSSFPNLGQMPTSSRLLMALGIATGCLPFLALARSTGRLSLRILRKRRAFIEFRRDRLVIHDSWMLNEPIELQRSEIHEIHWLPPLPWRDITAFASSKGQKISELGPLLDFATRPNVAVSLYGQRTFHEPARNWLAASRSNFVPLAHNAKADCLLLHVVDKDASAQAFEHWMREAAYGAVESRAARPSRLRRGLAWAISGIVGAGLFIAGLSLMA